MSGAKRGRHGGAPASARKAACSAASSGDARGASPPHNGAAQTSRARRCSAARSGSDGRSAKRVSSENHHMTQRPPDCAGSSLARGHSEYFEARAHEAVLRSRSCSAEAAGAARRRTTTARRPTTRSCCRLTTASAHAARAPACGPTAPPRAASTYCAVRCRGRNAKAVYENRRRGVASPEMHACDVLERELRFGVVRRQPAQVGSGRRTSASIVASVFTFTRGLRRAQLLLWFLCRPHLSLSFYAPAALQCAVLEGVRTPGSELVDIRPHELDDGPSTPMDVLRPCWCSHSCSCSELASPAAAPAGSDG